MLTVSSTSREPEPTPENLSIAEGLQKSSLNIDALEKFDHCMAENTIQSFLNHPEMVEPQVSSSNSDQEMLADKLASEVIKIALREACRGPTVESSTSAGVRMSDGQAEIKVLNTDREMDPAKELQSSKDTHPPLSQSGLPVVGSLDYPDAPPTTPTLPELERSRHSFARKLKGGLAKVFLPSPPPPTPKDKEEDLDSLDNDPRVELMEHLMHSLCTDDTARDVLEVAPQHGATVEAFAEALSCDTIKWVLSSKTRKQIAVDGDLQLLAHQLAETIITSSLDEAKMLI
ncbi:hypothetical protein EXN66_Car013381 [Channa argus]|uniref:Uncharacterized protein n=2 Tax=Channa argus TaxID=215402 RepID=A0A6G1Q504_CHAAH|nr:hypothetical protein EXN66_Car013381 [Channa argus]KAK2900019.1 hypothetical protein Q8A73_013148 [Channa argus]